MVSQRKINFILSFHFLKYYNPTILRQNRTFSFFVFKCLQSIYRFISSHYHYYHRLGRIFSDKVSKGKIDGKTAAFKNHIKQLISIMTIIELRAFC